MNSFPFDIIGFDLDGTLVDSALDLCPALNHALQASGRGPVTIGQARTLVGGGARVMLERALRVTGGLLEADAFDAAHALLLEHYTANIAANTMAYDGCLAALDELAVRGCRLAVLTNKDEALARKLLAELGMGARFASIMGGDTLGRERSKPAPDMIHETVRINGGGRFAMVGDSAFDVRAARNAAVPMVALSFGYHDVPPQELGADAVIDHFDELLPALERLGQP
jgi:phosphoglycolate phosphatase